MRTIGPSRRHSLAASYDGRVDPLEGYQRLIQYWGVMFDRRNELATLDCMNFSLEQFPEVLSVAEVAAIQRIESGYASPDGEPELGELIRRVELARLLRHSPDRGAAHRALVARAGTGCGAGTSGAIMAVMRAILRLPPERFPRANRSPEAVFVVPNYPVCAAQLDQLRPGLTPRYVHARRENGYLATYDEVVAAVSPQTVMVALTYPSNPAQTTYEGTGADELARIVRFCQAEGIFLLVDNIYQELVYGPGRRFEEVFAYADGPDYVVKFYGPSKDTPFYAGYRIGYWFGDPRLQAGAREGLWAAENSANPTSMAMFAMALLFRTLRADDAPLRLDDVRHLETGVFGWGRQVDRRACFDALSSARLFERFNRRLDHAEAAQRTAVRRVRQRVEELPSLAEVVNGDIGNVCLIRVDPAWFDGSDVDLFHLLADHGLAVLPGNAFGLPLAAGEAWFRMTLVHASIDTLLERLERVDAVVRTARG